MWFYAYSPVNNLKTISAMTLYLGILTHWHPGNMTLQLKIILMDYGQLLPPKYGISLRQNVVLSIFTSE
jgi:hypothetical protein